MENNFHSGIDIFINFPRSKLLALGFMPRSSASMAHPLISSMGQLIMIVYAHFCNRGTIIIVFFCSAVGLIAFQYLSPVLFYYL